MLQRKLSRSFQIRKAMNLKAGDSVKIISRAEFNKRSEGKIYASQNGCMFVMNEDMSRLCGKKTKVVSVINSHFKLDIDNETHNWCEWMVNVKIK